MGDLPKSKSYSEYGYATQVLTRIIDSWTCIDNTTVENRNLRYTKDSKSHDLRVDGIIAPDEIYAPVRVIDTNIRREQPQYINYICQSPRSLVFVDPQNATAHDLLARGEADFTKRARYLGWEKSFLRTVDGMLTHGWDSVEVMFDASLPGNFAIEQIGHADLILPLDCEDIQAQEVIARRIRVTSYQLNKYITEYDFDAGAVNEIVHKNVTANKQIEDTIHCVYKIFYKENNCVYVAWYHKDASKWLKAPQKLFLGRRDITQQPVLLGYTPEGMEIIDYPQLEERSYPIYLLAYVESEEAKITELKGRADMDEATQEACSGMQSALVNGCLRASQIMGSPKQNNLNANPQASPKLTDVVLKGQGLYDQPLDFFHTPWPDPTLIQGFQSIISQNQNEQNQVNFAVLNRKDSNKTATEVDQANKKSQELGSVQIILLSIFIRSVYSLAWSIYQNRVLQRKIMVDQSLMPFFAREDGQPKDYILRSSGDVDVIERDQKLNRMMQSWSVLANTPVAMLVLEDIIKLSFPDDAERYVAALKAGDKSKELIMKQAQIIEVLSTDETGQPTTVAQQAQGELAQLQQEVQQALQAPMGQNGVVSGVDATQQPQPVS